METSASTLSSYNNFIQKYLYEFFIKLHILYGTKEREFLRSLLEAAQTYRFLDELAGKRGEKYGQSKFL